MDLLPCSFQFHDGSIEAMEQDNDITETEKFQFHDGSIEALHFH